MKHSENPNPFYGMNNTLAAITSANNHINIDAMWNESKTSLEKRILFYKSLFQKGSIANRHPIELETAQEKGGESNSTVWLSFLLWLIKNDKAQFIKLLKIDETTKASPIIMHVGLREFSYELRSDKRGNVTQIWGLLPEIVKDNELLQVYTDVLAHYVNSIDLHRWLVAKHIPVPSFSKRKNKAGVRKELSPEAFKKMKAEEQVLKLLSSKVGWEMIQYPKNIKFKGFIEFKKTWGKNLEFKVFSERSVLRMDKDEFKNFVRIQPNGGRHAVKKRMFSDKWAPLPGYYAEYENTVLKAQREERVLAQKVANGQALTREEQKKLETAKIVGKVNTGAETLFSQIDSLVSGKADDALIHSMMSKIKFDLDFLLFVDVSSSMSGRPNAIANILATFSLMKQKKDENLIVTFGTHTTILTDNVKTQVKNRFSSDFEPVTVAKIVDKSKTFSENFQVISKLLNAHQGGTSLSDTADTMKKWVDEEDGKYASARIDTIKSYELFVVVSDGDLNSSHGPSQSMLDFQTKMRNYFGWNGVIFVWNVPRQGSDLGSSKFAGIPNIISMQTYNPSIIDQVFSNIGRLEIPDVYKPLEALYNSNRFQDIVPHIS